MTPERMKFSDFFKARQEIEGDKPKSMEDSLNSLEKGVPALKDKKSPTVRVSEKDKAARLGDEATPALKSLKHNHPLGEKPNYAGLTTEEFLSRTESLDNEAFANLVLEEAKKGDDKIPPLHCQYSGRAVMPSAFEVAKFMAHVIPNNEAAATAFFDELKNVPGGLDALLSEMCQHDEMYRGVVEQMGNAEIKVARRLAHAMNENHINFMNEMGLMMRNESVDVPMQQRLPQAGLPNSNMAQAMNAPPAQGGQQPMNSGMAPGMGAAPPAGPAPGQQQPAPDAAGNRLLSDTPRPIDSASIPNKPKSAAMELNKEFSYHHMIREMSKYEPMSNVMKEVLGL